MPIEAIITTPSESSTPYTLIYGQKEYIQSFDIKGCDEEWCQLVEDTDYPIEINFTVRKY